MPLPRDTLEVPVTSPYLPFALHSANHIYRGVLDRLLLTTIWLPVALLGIYAKHAILGEKQWRILAHAFHRASTSPAAAHFSVLERATLYASDCLIGFAVVPALFVLGLMLLPRKLWSVSIVLVSSSLATMLLFQMEALNNVGHFIPWYLVYDLIYWGIHHPHFIGEYAGRFTFVKWAIFVGAVVLSGILLHPTRNPIASRPLLERWVTRGILALMVCAALFGSLGMAGALARTWLGRAAIPAIFSATIFGNDDVGTAAHIRSSEALHQEYAAVAGSGPIGKQYWAKARDYDVLVFVLETAPSRYDSFHSLDDLPTLNRLAAHSWIGESHYSTFPYTAKATFSILTSMYPPNPLFFGGAPKQASALVRALSSAGYDTSYYVPHAFETHFEDAMYAALGFHTIFTSELISGSEPAGRKYYQDVLRRDTEALHALMRDAHHETQQGRRYLAVFSPQIGHAPWPDLVHDDARTPLGERARALLRLQDQWLGQIVEQLTRDGRIDRTIILVTGDHGIRTATEDPEFDPHGLLPDYSFHVPLLIYAPKVLEARQAIHGVTSHIDLAPTILDLLGVESGRGFEQGRPVWDVEESHRKVFLWAGDYLGAEGFEQDNHYTVWNKTAGYVFTGDSLNEDQMRMVPAGSAEQVNAIRAIRSMTRLNSDWWVSAMPQLNPGRSSP
jgi:arylsulfatase A-like enzyme